MRKDTMGMTMDEERALKACEAALGNLPRLQIAVRPSRNLSGACRRRCGMSPSRCWRNSRRAKDDDVLEALCHRSDALLRGRREN